MPSPKLKTSVTEERLWVFLDVFDDMKKVNIISLGCSKNLVDTEMLLKQLDQAVYLVGIKRRGVPLAKMLKTNIESFSNLKVHLGELMFLSKFGCQ